MSNVVCQVNVDSARKQDLPPFVPLARGISLTFPKELTRQLNRCQILILQLLVEVCAVIDSKTGKLVFRDLHPTERWIAERLGFSREWISKCLSRLARMGLVEVIRRRDEKTGRFLVNEYRLTKKTIGLLVRVYDNFDSIFKRKYVISIKQRAREIIEWIQRNKNNPNWVSEREFTVADVVAAAYALKVFKIKDRMVRKMLWNIVSEPYLSELEVLVF